jgi:hypothetical protein
VYSIASPRRAKILHRCIGLSAATVGHPSDRRQPEPGKIRHKGGRRPSRVTRSALVRDLARLDTGVPGGWPALAARAPGADRCGAQLVRRAAGTTRAPTPPWPGGPKSGRRRPGAQCFPQKARPVIGGSCAASGSAPSLARRCPRALVSRARRAPRALEAVKIFLTTSDGLCADHQVLSVFAGQTANLAAADHEQPSIASEQVPLDALHLALRRASFRPTATSTDVT